MWDLGRAAGLGKREVLLVVPEEEGEIRDDEKDQVELGDDRDHALPQPY